MSDPTVTKREHYSIEDEKENLILEFQFPVNDDTERRKRAFHLLLVKAAETLAREFEPEKKQILRAARTEEPIS